MEADILVLSGDMGEIFKRDQRTIKNRKDVNYAVDTYQVEFCDDCKKDRFHNRGAEGDDFSIRLVEVFIFGVCLLTIVQAPTAMSAPTSCRERDGADGSIPKWKIPCGEELVQDNYSGSVSSGENDRDLIIPILTAAKIAKDYMLNFRESYVRETFQVSYDKHLNMTKSMVHYSWLPNKETEVPKNLGEKVDVDHLKAQKLDSFLRTNYESMQKYAVGIEQVVWDQKKMNGNFRGQFIETESNLRKVLCELRTAMYIKNIPPKNVDRCIMDDTARMTNETAHRNLRDWIIFKECLNGLEYLIEVLENLKATSPS